MARPALENTIYARELGFTGNKCGMIVKRLGGAQKLRALSPECRAILLAPLGKGSKRPFREGKEGY